MSQGPEDFEQAWARIVAELGPELPATLDLTSSEPADPTDAPPDASGTVPTDAASGTADEPDPDPGAHPDMRRPADPGPDPGAFVSNWEDEGHYRPPPPPELPVGTPIKRLAWAGLLGGPAVLALAALTAWNPPPVVAAGAGLATLAGFATLVWLLPESREDGWDDGAQV